MAAIRRQAALRAHLHHRGRDARRRTRAALEKNGAYILVADRCRRKLRSQKCNRFFVLSDCRISFGNLLFEQRNFNTFRYTKRTIHFDEICLE